MNGLKQHLAFAALAVIAITSSVRMLLGGPHGADVAVPVTQQ